MFTQWFFTTVTAIITGFFAFLWVPLAMPYRTSFIVAIITFSATIIYQLFKEINSYEKQKIRGF